MDSVTAFAPASIANVGPCYDIMGYALDYVGDFVNVEKTERTDDNVIWCGVDGPRSGGLANIDY